VHRRLRGPFVALIALALTLSFQVNADASRSAPEPGEDQPTYTRAEAKEVLVEVKEVLDAPAEEAPARTDAGDLTMKLRDLFLARPYLTGADRRTADRLLSRKTAAANSAPTTARAAAPPMDCSTHFCVHYQSTSAKQKAWVKTTLDTLEHVWKVEVAFMDRAPLPDGGTAGNTDNPDNRLDVFLDDIGDQGLYGSCTGEEGASTSQVSAYCVLDDDYSKGEYGADPIESLRVTAAHEFFHAIQFGMDVRESLWFMEGSATWMEDHVYDSINDNYQYLPTSPIRHPRTSLDNRSSTFPYGSFIFFTYGAERKGASIVRRFWDAAVGDTTSYQAIYKVVGASSWRSYFATFGAWNTLPPHSYSERGGYPTPVFSSTKTFTSSSRSTGLQTVAIPRLAHSTLLLRPGSTLSTGANVMIWFNGPNTSTGTTALLQRRYLDGRVTYKMLSLGANGNGHILVKLNRKVLRSVVLIQSNTARSGGRQTFKVRAGLA
jgi:hypothetical protein